MKKFEGSRGFSTLSLQTQPFAALWAHFVLKFFQLLTFILGSPFPYYPREVEAHYEEREFTRNGWGTAPSVLGEFKLVQLQPVNLIFCPKREERRKGEREKDTAAKYISPGKLFPLSKRRANAIRPLGTQRSRIRKCSVMESSCKLRIQPHPPIPPSFHW